MRLSGGAPGQDEVVQRGEDQPGVPPPDRHRLDRAERLVGLTQGDGDALVQRRRFGDVDLAVVPVHLSECARPTRGYLAWSGVRRHPDDRNLGSDEAWPRNGSIEVAFLGQPPPALAEGHVLGREVEVSGPGERVGGEPALERVVVERVVERRP